VNQTFFNFFNVVGLFPDISNLLDVNMPALEATRCLYVAGPAHQMQNNSKRHKMNKLEVCSYAVLALLFPPPIAIFICGEA
jgi:hypothetical protein